MRGTDFAQYLGTATTSYWNWRRVVIILVYIIVGIVISARSKSNK